MSTVLGQSEWLCCHDKDFCLFERDLLHLQTQKLVITQECVMKTLVLS